MLTSVGVERLHAAGGFAALLPRRRRLEVALAGAEAPVRVLLAGRVREVSATPGVHAAEAALPTSRQPRARTRAVPAVPTGHDRGLRLDDVRAALTSAWPFNALAPLGLTRAVARAVSLEAPVADFIALVGPHGAAARAGDRPLVTRGVRRRGRAAALPRTEPHATAAQARRVDLECFAAPRPLANTEHAPAAGLSEACPGAVGVARVGNLGAVALELLLTATAGEEPAGLLRVVVEARPVALTGAVARRRLPALVGHWLAAAGAGAGRRAGPLVPYPHCVGAAERAIPLGNRCGSHVEGLAASRPGAHALERRHRHDHIAICDTSRQKRVAVDGLSRLCVALLKRPTPKGGREGYAWLNRTARLRGPR